MVLYTTQSPEVYRIIQEDGIYFCDIRKSQVFDLFERSYNWLEGKVGEKVRRPAAAKGLIWAYHTLPEWFDYRYSGEIGKQNVFMRLEVPDEQVTFIEAMKWQNVIDCFGLGEAEDFAAEGEYDVFDTSDAEVPPEVVFWQIKREYVKEVIFYICEESHYDD